MTLYEHLERHNESDIYPFHMPGHKRNDDKAPIINPYELDITEIDGFDDLHHAQSILKEAQDNVSGMYGTKSTHFLINGCSGGLLAAITACCKKRKGIIIARNCHKSVYNAVMIRGLTPYYVWPCNTEGIMGQKITAENVMNAIETSDDIGCIVITSPTYEGVVSDVGAIAEAAHKKDVVLIVDEAHGAHFNWNSIFPESAVNLGADIVIHGIHKTLPAFTQTALLHICSDRVDPKEVERYLGVYQSSSPSYLLMGSIDYCMRYLGSSGSADYTIYAERLKNMYNKLDCLNYLYILPYGRERDASKIVVCTDRVAIDGRECYNILREKYNLQPEMSQAEYVILMTSVWDRDDAYDRLADALIAIDTEYGALGCKSEYDERDCINKNGEYPVNEYICNIDTAVSVDGELVKLDDAEGMVSGDMVYIYPPGIPYIVPGERISRQCIEKLLDFAGRGYDIIGMADEEHRMIKVICYDICYNG